MFSNLSFEQLVILASKYSSATYDQFLEGIMWGFFFPPLYSIAIGLISKLECGVAIQIFSSLKDSIVPIGQNVTQTSMMAGNRWSKCNIGNDCGKKIFSVIIVEMSKSHPHEGLYIWFHLKVGCDVFFSLEIWPFSLLVADCKIRSMRERMRRWGV